MVFDLLQIIFDGMSNVFGYTWVALALVIGSIFLMALLIARSSYLLSAGFTLLILLPAVTIIGVNIEWAIGIGIIILGVILAFGIGVLFRSR